MSLLGATASAGDAVPIRLEHGNLYTEKLQDGSVIPLVLKANYTIVQAFTERLTPAATVGEDTTLALWRRGVCGWWDMSYVEEESELNKPDLSDLTEIQI